MPQANIKSIRADFVNPLARMLPLYRWQSQVYRMAESTPPGLAGFQPRWEVVNAVLGAQQTIQLIIDLMTDFHLLAVLGSASVNTALRGFRVHLYDKARNLRVMANRGLQFPNLGGNSAAPYFLREPYPFDLPKSQALVILQNLETASNTVQLVLYGVAKPFTGQLSNE